MNAWNSFGHAVGGRRMLGITGVAASILLLVGCAGPWIVAGPMEFSGLDGVGWVPVSMALAAISIHVGVAMGRIRWAALASAVIGAVCLCVAWIVTLGIHLAGHATTTVLRILIAGFGKETDTGLQVTAGWGLHLVEVASIVLIASALASMMFAKTSNGSSFGTSAGRRGPLQGRHGPDYALPESAADDLL
jgi:hypothetical protein